MNYRTLALAVSVAVVAATGISLAQEGGMLALIDKDGDGNVSAGEVAESAKSQFTDADTNKDGALSEAEFVAFREKYFKTLDTNGDGVVTRAEMRTRFLAGAFR